MNTHQLDATAMSHGYSLARVVFLRALSFIYGVAFLVAYHQNRGLIGDTGISPARRVLDIAERRGARTRQQRDAWLEQMQNSKDGGLLHRLGMMFNRNERYKRIREVLWDRCDGMERPVTTVLWFAKDRAHLNAWLDGVALSGLGLASMVLVLGSANVPLLLGLWICQRSLMAVGGAFYGFGWEPQLAELGFHAMFLVPFLSLDRYVTPVPMLVVWAVRWYLFRIMMGAGLIKIKSGEPKWRNLSAMDTFYETQPVPNPFTKYFHSMPRRWHQFEVLSNHFVELIAPWLLICPGLPVGWRRAGGFFQLIFQCVLIMSGNLSFLNWLTMVPAILTFDDGVWQSVFPSSEVALAQTANQISTFGGTSTVRQLVTIFFGALISTLSVPVIQNLLAKRQKMNASFDKLRLVNSYGAFGSGTSGWEIPCHFGKACAHLAVSCLLSVAVNDERRELIVKAAADIGGPWKEYEFQVKPGDVMRHPRWISPYHYRLDWQMWIAATIGRIERSPWILNFLIQLLRRNEVVTGLLKNDPWKDSPDPPKYIRIDVYRYKFHRRSRDDDKPAPFWDREYMGRFYPRQGIATVGSLKDELGMYY
jgi:hypothetical protein